MSSEPLSYMLGMIGLALAVSIAIGVLVAWPVGVALDRWVPRAAQPMRVGAGALLVVTGLALWRTASLTFLADALILGLGVGFLVDAARRRRRLADARRMPATPDKP